MTRDTRIYTDLPLSVSATMVLQDAASHHLLRVLRRRQGDEIILFNGDGHSYPARVVAVSRRLAEVEILGVEPREQEAALRVTLGVGVSRSVRFDYALQKATELGVSAIIPLLTERAAGVPDSRRAPARMQHWRRILIHACEQTGRNTLPLLDTPRLLHEWLGQTGYSACLMFTPTGRQTLSGLTRPDGEDAGLLIGPEGGLTEAEQEAAKRHGYSSIRLGPRTLRTETAVVAALTAVQVLWGDLG